MEADTLHHRQFRSLPTELADRSQHRSPYWATFWRFPPPLSRIASAMCAGAAHLALLRQLAETLLETPKLDFSSPAVISLPAGVADSLARLVSDHLPAVTSVGLLPRLLDSLVRLLHTTAGMPGTAGLVVSALNELFVNAGEIPPGMRCGHSGSDCGTGAKCGIAAKNGLSAEVACGGGGEFPRKSIDCDRRVRMWYWRWQMMSGYGRWRRR